MPQSTLAIGLQRDLGMLLVCRLQRELLRQQRIGGACERYRLELRFERVLGHSYKLLSKQ